MKTIILGFDFFDPAVFEDMAGRNQLPNLSKFADAGGYSRFEVCAPPQTEVSWTCIATGADPGGHGIFDFVHRDPATYAPYVSILPTKKTALGEQFIPPYVAKTLFEEAAGMGYPATALWWPAMFPARPELPVNTLPGLGTPDIRGQLGVGTLFTTEDEKKPKTAVVRLEFNGKGRYAALLSGPPVKGKSGLHPATLPLALDVVDTTSAKLTIGDRQLQLRVGEWSDIVEIKFKAGTVFQHSCHHAGNPHQSQWGCAFVYPAFANSSPARPFSLCLIAILCQKFMAEGWCLSDAWLAAGYHRAGRRLYYR